MLKKSVTEYYVCEKSNILFRDLQNVTESVIAVRKRLMTYVFSKVFSFFVSAAIVVCNYDILSIERFCRSIFGNSVRWSFEVSCLLSNEKENRLFALLQSWC